MDNQSRKYLPTLSNLIDRLSINQLKEVFIYEHKEKYALEIEDILHDIDLIIESGKLEFDAETIRAIVVLSQINAHIWYNESKVRVGNGEGDLSLTHSLNGVRHYAANLIEKISGGRIELKTDCLADSHKTWEISW